MASEIWKRIVQSYLIDVDNISEIEANGTSSLFVRRDGRREEIKNVFRNEEDYKESIKYLISMIKPSFDVSNLLPENLEEGRLIMSNGGTARVHIVLPPATFLPQVTIAKKTVNLTTLESIYSSGSMSTKMYNFLKAAIDAKLNIVFSGSTGSGKTTVLEAMSKLIPMDTRIGVVEDSPELTLIQPNVTYLKSNPWKPGMNPNDEVTLDWCTRQINRMRTDLLIIGETRGKEFKEFLTGANSGMPGSMTTLHANSPKLALEKMSQFVIEAQPVPVRVANNMIAKTIDIVVQLSKPTSSKYGKYKTTAIEEVSELLGNDESATIATTNLTNYDEINNVWSDRFLISDKLRYRLESLGYDCNTFTKGGRPEYFKETQSTQQTQQQPVRGIPMRR